MSSTTVNQPADEQAAAALGEKAAPVVDVLHKIWLAGLGVVAIAGKQTGRMLDALVEEGKHLEPALVKGGKTAAEGVGHAVSGLGSQLKKVPDVVRVKESGESAMKSALTKMGLPTKEEFDALAMKIDALNARLDAMRQGGGKPEPGF